MGDVLGGFWYCKTEPVETNICPTVPIARAMSLPTPPPLFIIISPSLTVGDELGGAVYAKLPPAFTPRICPIAPIANLAGIAPL